MAANLTIARVLVVVALVIAGCGSSDETTSESATETTTESTTPPSAETDVLDQLPQVPAPTETTAPPNSLRGVFDDVQAMWKREFEEAGSDYTPATLTIFRDQVDTACGAQSANVGPFYCPADHGVYLDTRFFDALGRAAGVQLGHFAQAYVVAHEVGHHVQTLLGVMQQRPDARRQAGPRRRERPLGAPRAAGRLLRRHLEAPALPARAARARRTSRTPCARPRWSATTSSSAGHGNHHARGLDPRLVPAAPALADDRIRAGPAVCVRHVCRCVFDYPAKRFPPALRDAGVDEATLQTLTVQNPRRWLTIAG